MEQVSTPTTPDQTFAQLLGRRLRQAPGQPLITAYDDASGERTELSATTYGNWVSKTANLFTDELGLDEGDVVLLELPEHWLVPVFLGAAWAAGLAVTTDPSIPHELRICGPAGLEESAAGAAPVLACSLRPFGVRFATPLPAEVLDYGLMWPGQSDVFVPVVVPDAGTTAWLEPEGPLTQGDLLRTAHPGTADRLITDLHPAAGHGVPAFLGPLTGGGSLVLVINPDDEQWPAHLEGERATAELRR